MYAYVPPQRLDLAFGWGSNLKFSVKVLEKQPAGAPKHEVHLIGFITPSTSLKASYGTDDEDEGDGAQPGT